MVRTVRVCRRMFTWSTGGSYRAAIGVPPGYCSSMFVITTADEVDAVRSCRPGRHMRLGYLTRESQQESECNDLSGPLRTARSTRLLHVRFSCLHADRN